MFFPFDGAKVERILHPEKKNGEKHSINHRTGRRKSDKRTKKVQKMSERYRFCALFMSHEDKKGTISLQTPSFHIAVRRDYDLRNVSFLYRGMSQQGF